MDALGPDAYYGDSSADGTVAGCHRAEESVANLGRIGLQGKVLACAGATTASSRAQIRQLRRFAAHHDVRAVIVSIGGNDFGFGSVLATCLNAFIRTAQSDPQPCFHMRSVTRRFSNAPVHRVAGHIAATIDEVAAAMRHAGYSPSGYRLLVLTYPSPLPPPQDIRYPQTLRARLWRGGCPLFNADLAASQHWQAAVNRAVTFGVRGSGVPNAELLDMSNAFEGHRLCERGVGRLEDTGLASWRAPAAAAQLEWVNRFHLTFAASGLQDSMHPNYWGMLAERSCVASALRLPKVLVRRCVPTALARDRFGPQMTLR